ncbi:MAG: hydrogenase iron-sulfur subunit [Methanomassiliicoccales archaeon]|nr:MAG: hydrogenase iron-sulfur subunit [Methanomassiliicoccales archaeon]
MQEGEVEAEQKTAADTTFEPNIIAFCCNWCSYAGADLAGVSRLQYPPNIRIVRVMCSGRVEPSFLLDALESGADGILVTGCHIGDCHYISGNKKAETKVKMVQNLLDMLGVGSDRLRLEWISASEASKFAEVMNEFNDHITQLGPNPLKFVEREPPDEQAGSPEIINGLIQDTRAFDCVECGKCTSVCPVAMVDEKFAPRLIVVKAQEGASSDLAKEKDIWTCNTCGICSAMCPYKVDYPEFIRGLRVESAMLGTVPSCSQGGLLQSTMRIMANSDFEQKRLDWVDEDSKIADTGDVFFFTGCLPQMEVIFQDRELKMTDIARSAVKIMNKAGVVPVVSNKEKCCGHDLNWTGDEESVEKLMDHNLDVIRKSGAKTVVFTCAECFRTFNIDYQAMAEEDLDFRMLHISQYVNELIDSGKLKFKDGLSRKITYHEPCRLSRHCGVYDAPRDTFAKISGIDIVEMENIRDKSTCCGVSAWMNCDANVKKSQIDRMMEAKRTDAEVVLTACPKCYIHLDCSVRDEVPVEKEMVDIPLEDYTIAVAKALED